ncbi:TDT family transporter [Agarivorans sp. TSD2052]|uniref:TDT family transporter n=1 Tax=Agarivorans sp. TSD2052 TaxID=2937286 RepID=UPI00201071D4|nr:TDT family transporter [Agarivorans sp. TSD2052]UPW19629.1 TDT family transporter [Agarivorans sp. TSD2052]
MSHSARPFGELSRVSLITAKILSYPTALAGLALAIASLGLTWEGLLEWNGAIQHATAIIASLLLLPILIKFVLKPSLFFKELAHPVAGAMLPVITMSIMVMAKSLADIEQNLAVVVSFSAFVIQIALFVAFSYQRYQDFQLTQLIPCWFIPPIGLALFVVVAPIALPQTLKAIILYGALIAYLMLLPLIVYRLYTYPIPAELKPLLAIMATPASLILLGFLVSGLPLTITLMAPLTLLALVMTIAVYFALLSLLKLPFSPSYAAFTFPLVVSATALFSLKGFLQEQVSGSRWQILANVLPNLELIIATSMVLYVAACYIKHYTLTRA